jgi:hypothetical protein
MAAQFTPDGYVVLETIPFRSLRFPNAPKQIRGIMLGRFIYRNNEFSMWPAISRRRSPQFVGQFGDMEIADDISPGRNLQFIPYGLFSNGYLGYTHARENLAFDPLLSPSLYRTDFPGTTTGRQIFIKLSYMLRY